MTQPFDVRMKGFRDRADVADFLRIIDERITALEAETADIHRAIGRSLAEAVVAPVSVPGFARAAMDGYAVRGEDTFGASSYNELPLTIAGQALPGSPCDATVQPGQAVRIMTGAPVPAGANAVLMAEYAREVEGKVYVSEPVAPAKNVGRVGEDFPQGAAILTPPRRLRPQDLAVCAAAGVAEVQVHRQPKIEILVTGNELLPTGSRPSGYQIVDSNSLMLKALVQRDGGVVLGPEGSPHPILEDNREAIQNALVNSGADCILISGGSSVGKEDFAPVLLAELGELVVHGVALRPASPSGLGFLGRRPVFLLPGNPVSCLCAYDLFAGRAIHRLAGRPAGWPYVKRHLPLQRKISSVSGRVDYVRVRVAEQQTVEPLAISGASILSSTTRADGFVLVPKDLEGYDAQTVVDVWLYDAPCEEPSL